MAASSSARRFAASLSTGISRGEAEQITAELAARCWPQDAARLPWVALAYLK